MTHGEQDESHPKTQVDRNQPRSSSSVVVELTGGAGADAVGESPDSQEVQDQEVAKLYDDRQTCARSPLIQIVICIAL